METISHKVVILENQDIMQATDGLVAIPVNTVGVMGAGLALQFKKKYHTIFKDYRTACLDGELLPGGFFAAIVNNDLHYGCVTTKEDWKRPAETEWIVESVREMLVYVQTAGIKAIHLPRLGCGLGWVLEWADVKQSVLEVLSEFDGTLYLYE